MSLTDWNTVRECGPCKGEGVIKLDDIGIGAVDTLLRAMGGNEATCPRCRGMGFVTCPIAHSEGKKCVRLPDHKGACKPVA